jgi:hypothetical protein
LCWCADFVDLAPPGAPPGDDPEFEIAITTLRVLRESPPIVSESWSQLELLTRQWHLSALPRVLVNLILEYENLGKTAPTQKAEGTITQLTQLVAAGAAEAAEAGERSPRANWTTALACGWALLFGAVLFRVATRSSR